MPYNEPMWPVYPTYVGRSSKRSTSDATDSIEKTTHACCAHIRFDLRASRHNPRDMDRRYSTSRESPSAFTCP
eukprot:2353027-Pyramimonas_sp.AAC.1